MTWGADTVAAPGARGAREGGGDVSLVIAQLKAKRRALDELG